VLQTAAVTDAAVNPKLAPRERFELPLPDFVGRCSVQLSQRGNLFVMCEWRILVVADGIGPSTTGL